MGWNLKLFEAEHERSIRIADFAGCLPEFDRRVWGLTFFCEPPLYAHVFPPFLVFPECRQPAQIPSIHGTSSHPAR
jgi:hypothetical protein